MAENPFTTDESLAVARLIWALINSDQKITHNESDYFMQALTFLELKPAEFEAYLQLPEEMAYKTAKKMSASKRSQCATLLRLAYDSDQNVDRVELRKLNDILINASLFKFDGKNRKQDDGYII